MISQSLEKRIRQSISNAISELNEIAAQNAEGQEIGIASVSMDLVVAKLDTIKNKVIDAFKQSQSAPDHPQKFGHSIFHFGLS